MSNKYPPLPGRPVETSVVVTDRVFALAALATLLVALALAAGMGFLAFFAMRELDVVRDALRDARGAGGLCEIERSRVSGRLEQMESLVKFAADRGTGGH